MDFQEYLNKYGLEVAETKPEDVKLDADGKPVDEKKPEDEVKPEEKKEDVVVPEDKKEEPKQEDITIKLSDIDFEASEDKKE